MITAVQNDLPSNGDAGIENCNRASVASSSAVTSGNAGDLRRREVVLAKISLYMVFVFLICHSVKIVPNIYEMVQTYLEVRCFFYYRVNLFRKILSWHHWCFVEMQMK